jgi:hypothetical protein
MRADLVDPRDITWEQADPVYRVYFWHRPPPPAGIPAERVMWHCNEQRLIGAQDVQEVIGWANERLPAGDRYVLYVEQTDGGRRGLVRLAGIDPTESDEPDFGVTVELPE